MWPLAATDVCGAATLTRRSHLSCGPRGATSPGVPHRAQTCHLPAPPPGPSRQRPPTQQTLTVTPGPSASHPTSRVFGWLGHLLFPETPWPLTLGPPRVQATSPSPACTRRCPACSSPPPPRPPAEADLAPLGPPLLWSPGFAGRRWPVSSRLCRHRRLTQSYRDHRADVSQTGL